MLKTKQRKEYFHYLGLGDYDEETVLKLQKKYFPKKEHDGKYGSKTDRLLVNLYRVKMYAPHFRIEEFCCHCGGKYCTGYPEYLSIQLIKNLEAIRNCYGTTHISSGMRCRTWNSKQVGSAKKSKHTKGKAADIYGAYTKSKAGRQRVKNSWYKMPGSSFCYFGTANMGTAVHVDVR